MNIQEKIDWYVNVGYVPTPSNKSGLGTTVMYSDESVVRIGIDSAYDHYAELIIGNGIQSENAPNITKHEKPRGEFGNSEFAYSCTEMEILTELDGQEVVNYEKWIKHEIKNIGNGNTVNSDPFSILELTVRLVEYARKNGLGLDLIQAKNVMKRDSTFVHIDPFASI
jgi:hypothetical protein